ncbi:hypothetical protein Trydic_g21203 [Trypoxylus dichotomus]
MFGSERRNPLNRQREERAGSSGWQRQTAPLLSERPCARLFIHHCAVHFVSIDVSVHRDRQCIYLHLYVVVASTSAGLKSANCCEELAAFSLRVNLN